VLMGLSGQGAAKAAISGAGELGQICGTCAHWQEENRLQAEFGEAGWGACVQTGGTIRMICPYATLETRQDFGCIEWRMRGGDQGERGQQA